MVGKGSVTCAKCGITSKVDPSLTFHRFPPPSIHDSLKARVWAMFCFPDDDWTTNESLRNLYKQHKLLCSKHFDGPSFICSNRKTLNRFAIPTEAQNILAQLREELQCQPKDIIETPIKPEATTSTSQYYIEYINEPNPHSPIFNKGNETLVTEYEKSLAEITTLKGQILKLESTLLEVQIKSPLKNSDVSPELEYWKNYCDMLKEENKQLSLRVNALESSAGAGSGAGAEPQRVAQLQHTVLTLRGLVSKLQAEQKISNAQKRADSRPSSAKSSNDKIRNHDESRSIEISNLKKIILEKDELLQKSKEMLNMAVEKNERLARENMFLRRRLEELTD